MNNGKGRPVSGRRPQFGGDTMAVSESQKKASIKWDKENMATLGCKVKRDQAEKFKEKCRANNTTANEVLKECVLNYIGETSATMEVTE